MSARQALYELITTDPLLNELGVTAASTWNANSVDTPEVRPFVVIKWQTLQPIIGTQGPQSVAIWVHDKPYAYDVIDDIIARVDELLSDVAHFVGSDGSSITAANPQGISEDLFDDGYGTLTKNTSWSLVTRRPS